MSDEELSDDEIDQRRASESAPKPRRDLCPKCDHIVKPFYGKCPQCEGDANRIRVDRLAEVIRELKGSVSRDLEPERERLLVSHLELYGHPDAKGLLAWLSDERSNAAKSPRNKRR